tara:strand:- start:192 stop:545 length:354 start_codon:yes stop_codon:yes gene_type:complete
MLKGKKTKYGVVITKPHSKEMYDHNDKVSDMMKENLQIALTKAKDDEETLRQISKYICCSGFGMGYTLEDIFEETEKDLERMPNWHLDQEYDDMVTDELVPELFDKEGRKIGLVGFN